MRGLKVFTWFKLIILYSLVIQNESSRMGNEASIESPTQALHGLGVRDYLDPVITIATALKR